jgi:hypothetical protein
MNVLATGKFLTRDRTMLEMFCDTLIYLRIANSKVAMVRYGSPKFSIRLDRL